MRYTENLKQTQKPTTIAGHNFKADLLFIKILPTMFRSKPGTLHTHLQTIPLPRSWLDVSITIIFCEFY